MKKLEIVIRSEKLDDMKQILDECQVTGAMISDLMGYGRQKGYKSRYRGSEYIINLLPKIKVETVVNDDLVDRIIELVEERISTDSIGDGKIFIYNVEDCVKIRTGQRGPDAL